MQTIPTVRKQPPKTKLCACCGEEFQTTSHCRKYAPGHSGSADVWVPMGEFMTALRKLKVEKGATWAELAMKSGYTSRGFSSIIYGKQGKIRKSRVEAIFTRLNGGSMHPTDTQKATYVALSRKVQSELRADTLKDRSLQERKAKVAELRAKLGHG